MIHVSCAIIIQQKKILLCQRSISMNMPLKWEFPGGKIEAHETPQQSIIREIKEELNLDIQVIQKINEVSYHYPNVSITLYPFICEIKDHNTLELREHADAKWLSLSELKQYDLAEADRPIIAQIEQLWN